MITKNLFPNRWKPMGWLLLFLCIPPGIWYLVDEESFPFNAKITIPWPFGTEKSTIENITDGVTIISQQLTIDLIDELLAFGVIIGLMIVGFARLRTEDERIAQMRLEALQWAIYGNTLLLMVCILFIHGFAFLFVTIYTMFTPLLIFVGRFHWLVREMRDLKIAEGKEVTL